MQFENRANPEGKKDKKFEVEEKRLYPKEKLNFRIKVPWN